MDHDGDGGPPSKVMKMDDNHDLCLLLCSQESSVSDIPQETNWHQWSNEEVVEHLSNYPLENLAERMKEHHVRGEHLPLLTDDRLRSMGINDMSEIMDFQMFLQKVGCSVGGRYQSNTKICNDPIHGHIELHPLWVKIMDTPQFQRLRFIKQLGACYFVFPGAAHNRFEHSVGVGHLAGQLVRSLQRRQPELWIDDRDILCVEIAGLCHDLGHGPFSHLFDGQFIPRFNKGAKWKHEDASVKMFEHLIAENVLMPEFNKYGLTETDVTFIKEQIKGPLFKTEGYPYKGRKEEKRFLYEIVANKRNGIDVDKWDYFARDCHMLGIRNNFDHDRFIKFARVLRVDGIMQICARDKEASTVYDMFHTRSTLHRRAYQHKVNKSIEAMIVDAFVKANDYLEIPGANGKMVKLSECIDDMVAYTKLTDHVLHQILLSSDPNLKESKQIINNIFCRQLYKCVGHSQPSTGHTVTVEQTSTLKQQLIECMSEDDKESESVLEKDDIEVQLVNLDYGMKEKNPVDKVRFYNKAQPDTATELRKSEVSQMLPERFSEQMILVYCKDPNQKEKCGITARCFKNWCEKNNMEAPKSSPWEMTPAMKRGSSQGFGTPDGSLIHHTPAPEGKHKRELFRS